MCVCERERERERETKRQSERARARTRHIYTYGLDGFSKGKKEINTKKKDINTKKKDNLLTEIPFDGLGYRVIDLRLVRILSSQSPGTYVIHIHI